MITTTACKSCDLQELKMTGKRNIVESWLEFWLGTVADPDLKLSVDLYFSRKNKWNRWNSKYIFSSMFSRFR